MPTVSEEVREDSLLMAHEAAYLHGLSVDASLVRGHYIFMEAAAVCRPLCAPALKALLGTCVFVISLNFRPDA